MSLTRYRYIVVEGPIGAGKTSLTHKLAEHLGAETLLENATTTRSCRASTRSRSATRCRLSCISCSTARASCATWRRATCSAPAPCPIS